MIPVLAETDYVIAASVGGFLGAFIAVYIAFKRNWKRHYGK